MRRSLTIATPIAVGALVLALAAAYPASTVRGSSLTGPKPLTSRARLGHDYRAGWAEHDRVVLLRVRDGSACAPEVRRTVSTGPARIEVTLDRPTGLSCAAGQRWWSFRLPPPPIRARHQAVVLYVNGLSTSIPAPRV